MQNCNPKISVIIPVYNVEKFLYKSIKSVLNQTLTDIEIIIINDGSTDNSPEVISEISQNDKRVNIISQENQGQGVARNKGLKIAKGEYIFFLDPDDWIVENTLETLYNFAKENSAKIVKFNFNEYNEYSGKIKKVNFAKHMKHKFGYNLVNAGNFNYKQLKKDYLTGLDLHVWSYLYLTDFVKRNDIKFAPTRRGEDHLFVNSSILLADKIYYLDKYLYFYRCRKGSIINTKDKYNLQVFDNIRLAKEFLIQHSLYTELENEFTHYAQSVLQWHYEQTPDDLVEEYVNRCKKYFPSDKEFKKFLSKAKTNKKFIEKIFSLKNQRKNGRKYKVITILGVEFKFKPKIEKGVL